MKQLILVRHATAEPERFPQKDFDRVLADYGHQEVRQLGNFILEKETFPAHIACSAAARTKQTASLLKETLRKDDISLIESAELYNAGYQVLMDFIHKFSDEHQSMLLVAHNPGISQLATVLSSTSPYQFSTAAGLCLEFEASTWKNILHGSGKEIWYFYP
jgi:phosphohistidine phosphatase